MTQLFPLLVYPGEHVQAHDMPRSVFVHLVLSTKLQDGIPPPPNEVRFVLLITPIHEGAIHEQVGSAIVAVLAIQVFPLLP
jgi:hypothetical protein